MTRRSFFRAALPRTLATVLVMSATTAWAVVSSIVLTPLTPDPPVLGSMYALSPDQRAGIKDTEWSVKRKFGGCSISSYIFSQSLDVNVTAGVPGTYDFQLYNTYVSPGMGQPAPAPTGKDKSITIAAADSFDHIFGVHELVLNHGSIVVQLQVYSGTDACGPAMEGVVQEKMTNQVWNFEQLPDTDWFPVAPSATLKLVGSAIHDEVGATVDNQTFANWPLGHDFFTAHQEYRILYGTACPPPDHMFTTPLGGWLVAKRKKTATQWWYE